jgi:cytochrome c
VRGTFHRCLLLPLACFCLILSACTGGEVVRAYSPAVGGNPQSGQKLIKGYGCGSCHIIPGVHDANGLVGPPLIKFGARTMIAGELPNTPENLERWLSNPRAVEPGTAMPDLGLTQAQTADIAAYLYTLR